MAMARLEAKDRVGLLGGTFDPIHNGHLQVADIAAEQLSLCRVVFIPAAVPPHKPDQVITPFPYRAEMIRLALDGERNRTLSLVEQSLPKPSYTIDTVTELQSKDREIDYFYIIGLDAFLEINTWKSHEELLQRIHFIVVTRAGFHKDSMKRYLTELGYKRDDNSYFHADSFKRIFFIEKGVVDVSSSSIRKHVKEKKSIERLTPASVGEYIRKHKLYSQKEY